MEVTIGLSREAWGPRFWKLLHTMAELSGTQTNTILSNDEADAWIIFLKSQAFVMPCALCRTHYLEWQQTHKIEKIRSLQGQERKTYLCRWLWGCHTRVNELNEKDSLPYEQLSELYGKQPLEKEFRQLNTMFQQALTQQQLKPEDVARWKKVSVRLRILYSV
jgi:hypothetical protein